MRQQAKLPKFFKKIQHKQFNYAPMYYDARKEERDQRNKDIEAELNGGRATTYISNEFRENMSRAHGQSNRRVVLIIAALLLVAYYFMTS